nr:DELTA-alicitoxin-Pse2b-like [Pocillopora verrucosa]
MAGRIDDRELITLLLHLGLSLSEAKKATKGESEGLGKILFPPNINLLDDFQEKENSIFDPLPSECFKKIINTTKSSCNFDYYKNTKAFYKSLATESSLSASLTSTFTLGATVSVATKGKSSEKSEVSGISLIKQALAEKIYVDKKCLTSAKTSTLNEEFMEYLEELPLKIDHPWFPNFWEEYKTFLDKYGSHVITSVETGSRFQQMVFAESSESYSQRDFQLKACILAAGPTNVGKLNVSACSSVNSSEVLKAKNMSTSETRFVRGGLRDTNSALTKGTSAELIEKLMNEADEAPSPVQHTFKPVWEILKDRFKTGSKNHIRATILQYYYSGYLGYGCLYSKSGDVEVQKFDYTKQSESKKPEFECSLAKEGCHNDDDCHYVIGPWCTCKGKTCVRYKSVKQITGQTKHTAYINKRKWDWKGCGWKVAGSWCTCKNK